MAATMTQTNQNIDELKAIVSKTLEKQGILAKAQAQLRKHVFEALSSTEQQNASHYNVSPKINENDTNDKFAMALIRDFLEYHHLDYTLSLMNTESQKKMEVTQNITRNEIASRLGLGAQKPNPESSLLNQLVKTLFDADVFKPRNSTLTDDITLKPRVSTDGYRSSLDSTSFSMLKPAADTHNTLNQDALQNLELSLPIAKQLPPLPSLHKPSAAIEDIEAEEVEIDVSDLIEANSQTDTNKEEQYTDPGDALDDALDELLESSSNDDQAETQNGDAEELKRVEEMNKEMELLRLQASEFEKLKKESMSAVSSQTCTEYEDDFGSDVMEKQSINNEDEEDMEIEEIEEDIDEEICEESESISVCDEDTTENIYAAKDVEEEVNDDAITKDFTLENIADIIMDVKTEKIKYQL
eukprot:80302_1